MDNLRFYNRGREVPKEAQKQFNNGRFSGTDINPMWRIKMLTELFGPAGIGWYVEVISQRAEQLDDQNMMAIVDINLYIKDGDQWSKPIYGTGGNMLLAKGKPSDEGYKMAYTDAISVACKALGIGADVYFANDKTKYTTPSQQDAQETAQQPRQDAAKSSGRASTMASEIQREFIRTHASDEQYEKAMRQYGANLERLPCTHADALIAKIRREQGI